MNLSLSIDSTIKNKGDGSIFLFSDLIEKQNRPLDSMKLSTIYRVKI